MIHWECIETEKVRIRRALPEVPGDYGILLDVCVLEHLGRKCFVFLVLHGVVKLHHPHMFALCNVIL